MLLMENCIRSAFSMLHTKRMSRRSVVWSNARRTIIGIDGMGFFIDFGSPEKFKEFCEYAGIDPTLGEKMFRRRRYLHRFDTTPVIDRTYYFVSNDRKVVVKTDGDLTIEGRDDEGFIRYLTVTGKQERVKWLSKWIEINVGYC
mmetsp:Transcript_32322/g.78891  ORF Transcript_32322/g.78891 Transcript_32322/m.78891 type:complete len:144 (-) Transcript_32322:162-593(-)